jgi:hypothetical protein
MGQAAGLPPHPARLARPVPTAASDAPADWQSRSRTPPLRRPVGSRSPASPPPCATCHGNEPAAAQLCSQPEVTVLRTAEASDPETAFGFGTGPARATSNAHLDVAWRADEACISWTVLSIAGLLIVLVAALRPMSGSNIMGTNVSLDCGPAITAWLGISDPDSSGPPIMWPDSDLGVGRAAWCDLESRKWLWPIGATGLGMVAVGGVLLIAGQRRPRERETEPSP